MATININFNFNINDLDKIFCLLEQNQIKFDTDPTKILSEGLETDNVELVKIGINRSIKPDKELINAVKVAIIKGANEVIKYLFSNQIDLNMENGILLQLVCKYQRYDIIQLLCDCDVTANNHASLKEGLRNDDVKIVKSKKNSY